MHVRVHAKDIQYRVRYISGEITFVTIVSLKTLYGVTKIQMIIAC